MDLLSQSSLLLALTSFALGFATLSRNARNKLFIAFALVSGLISAWGIAFFLARVWGSELFYVFHLFLNIWLVPGVLGFVRVLVRSQDQPSRRLFQFALASSVGLSVALIMRWDQNPWVKELIYFLPALVVAQMLRLMWIDRRLKRGLKLIRKLPTVGFSRRNLIYFGALFVLCTSTMDHVPAMGRAIPALGNLGLTAYLFFVSQAISQQRLLNFSAMFSRFLVMVAVALSLAGVYSLLVAWIQNSPALFFLNSFIASFLILMLLEPIRATVGYFTQRLLTKEHRQLQQVLRDAQRTLAGIVDPNGLFQAILITVEQVLHPQSATLYTLRSDGTKYRRVKTSGDPAEIEARGGLSEVLASHALLDHCVRTKKRGGLPIVLDQILESEIDRTTSRTQREELAGLIQGLRALSCNLLIPLFDEEKILGFVTMYAPMPPEPWGSNWGLLPIIYPYFEQAGQTLRNMSVYVRSREKERLAAIGEMAAGLAHEIRNPLGAIKGAAQFLDPSGDRPESKFLKVILEEVDRLNRVVTEFLDYSRSGEAELHPVDLASLAAKTADFLKPTLPPEIQIRVEVGAGRYFAQAAGEQIRQVLLNLLQNSLKALSGKGSGGTIRIQLHTVTWSDKPLVAISVEDNGPGIRREHLDKLFIPFFTTSPGGTGLGLSICQKIVEAHSGRIEVASEEGKFARFTVLLPAVTE